MRFRPTQHIRRTWEFQHVRLHGRRRDCGAFLVHLCLFEESARLPVRRLGVVASKRVGNAVARNHAKRHLREVFRAAQEALPPNCDVVLTARRAIEGFAYETLERRFRAAVHQLAVESPVRAGEETPA
ncbi:MAG: ribonuclease P protein component [Opitutales bacterium]